MNRLNWAGAALAALAATAFADEPPRNYHEVIQDSALAIPVREFEKLEADAYAAFDKAEVYPPLIAAFATTSERIWAVIYAEIFANLTDDDAKRAEIGALAFRVYDDAISFESAEKMKISLTREWTFDGESAELTFEMNFELLTIVGLANSLVAPDPASLLEPLTLGALADARRQLLAIWREKKLPETELLRWQERVAQAGHFDAYNRWLYQSARPVEFDSWLRSNGATYEAWLQWRNANPMRLHVPDFHRLLLSAEDPELELLMAGRALLTANNPQEALRKSFEKVVQRFEARHAGSKDTIYCARSQEEALYYLAMAADADRSASVLPLTWSDAYYLKAYTLLELGRRGEARDALERALELAPNNSQYMSEMAYTYQIEKNWAESLERYQEAEANAESFSPSSVKAEELSRALRGQGYALVELERLDEAEAVYRKAIAADPEDRASPREIQYIEQIRSKQR